MLYLPKKLPAADVLRAEGCNIAEGAAPGGAALRVLLLNLMPQKAVTELDIARMLAAADRDVELTLLMFDGMTYKTTPMAHMTAYYRCVSDVTTDGTRYDGLIVTGAPVEHLEFDDVRYQPALRRLMAWADDAVRSTLYICWGAQAALNYYYGIPKYPLKAKKFGIFSQRVLHPENALMHGLSPAFAMPASRHTEVRVADFDGRPVELLAVSDESGTGVAASPDGRRVFVTGHLEYEPLTLEKEFLRDRAKGLAIAVPQHYYQNDDPAQPVVFAWEAAAKQFYNNWVQLLAH